MAAYNVVQSRRSSRTISPRPHSASPGKSTHVGKKRSSRSPSSKKRSRSRSPIDRRESSSSRSVDQPDTREIKRRSTSMSRSGSRPPARYSLKVNGDTSGNAVVVTNLTRTVTEDHVKEIFGVFGMVTNVDVTKDPVKPSRLKAVVIFESGEDTLAAVKHMDRGQIDGDIIRVTEFIQPKERPQQRSASLSPRGRDRSRGSWISESPPRKRRRGDAAPLDHRRRRSSSSDRRSAAPLRRRPRRPSPLPPPRRYPLPRRRRSISPSPHKRRLSDSGSRSLSRGPIKRRISKSRSASSWTSGSSSGSRSPMHRSRSRSTKSVSLDSTGRRRRCKGRR